MRVMPIFSAFEYRQCTVLFDDCGLNHFKFFSSLLPQALCYCPFYTEELAAGGHSYPVPFQAFYRSVIFYRSRWYKSRWFTKIGTWEKLTSYCLSCLVLYCSFNTFSWMWCTKLEVGGNFICRPMPRATVPLTLTDGGTVPELIVMWHFYPVTSHFSCYNSVNCYRWRCCTRTGSGETPLSCAVSCLVLQFL